MGSDRILVGESAIAHLLRICKLEKPGNLRFLVMPKKIRELKQMLRRVGFTHILHLG